LGRHFLLSAAARTLSLKAIFSGGEDAAYETFRRLRWPETEGEPVCPQCGGVEAYKITTRRRYKCKACLHQFSVTSGTIFASRKLSFMDLLAAISLFVNAVRGRSSVQLSREIGVQYKTAWVLAHKLREALQTEYEGATVSGLVDVDGTLLGGKPRKSNYHGPGVDPQKGMRNRRRLMAKKVVVAAIRQRGGRTLTFVVKREAEAVDIVRKVVQQGSIVFSDEAPHWHVLGRWYQVARVEHAEWFSKDGVHTNYVESFFSRLGAMVERIHYHVATKYLHRYSAHAAWLEDHRRTPNGTLVNRLLGAALNAPISRDFKGYWQRRQIP